MIPALAGTIEGDPVDRAVVPAWWPSSGSEERVNRKRKRVKTDPADAYELANLLRHGSLPEAHISPPDLLELRELVRHAGSL